MLFVVAAAVCDPVGTPTPAMTPQERRETYAVVRETCKAVGASEPVCEALVAVTWRESRGRPTVVHTRGPNEYGLGAHGFSWRFWRRLIEDAEQDDFCDPAMSTLAVLEAWQFFFRRGARRIKHLQRGYSGHRPTDDSRPYADARWCNLLEHGPRDDQHVVDWSVDCETRITAADLGRPIKPETIRGILKEIRSG